MTWDSLRKKAWLVSPQLKPWQRQAVQKLRSRVPQVDGMLWILSSGTRSVGSVKAIGLHEDSILMAAGAANRHLQASSKDRWLVAIPNYHIGGLAIYARAHLAGAEVTEFGKWSAVKFAERLKFSRVTLTSLVPTQIFDLVNARLQAPPDLRAVVVGGGSLPKHLYSAARKLGWPLLPSYGLTEVGSQVATASLDSLSAVSPKGEFEFPALHPLSHIQVELRKQCVVIRSPAVCEFVAVASSDGSYCLEDPRRQGWLITEDIAEWVGEGLRILGRRDSIVKVMGVLVPLLEVEAEVAAYFEQLGLHEPLAVVATAHDRLGTRLTLMTDSKLSLKRWGDCVDKYNRVAQGPRRIHAVGWTPALPRTDLNKVRLNELQRLFCGE